MRSMMRCMVLAVAGALVAGCASLGAAPPAPEASARVLYQIDVSAPGTRSQGWRGVLYGEDGAPIALAPGARIETTAGAFVGVACPYAWSTCGAVETRMHAWMQSHDHNINMRERWTYRLQARGDALYGELLRDGVALTSGDEVLTPMGLYRRTAAGWRHVSAG